MKRNKNKLIGTKQLLPKEKKRLLMLLLTILAIIGNLYAQNPQIWPTQISFNYEEGSSNDAIKIRKNASSSISVPEYVKDIRNENCAYIMGQSNRKIKVKFNSNNSNYNYMVKATVIDNGTGSSIGIGNVCEVFVAPCDFNTTEFTIALSGVVPEGIDKRTFTWKWEATALPINAPYCPIGCNPVNTTHTYYTLLDEPHAPITEPWTDVLDLACNWAYGAMTVSDAAHMITDYLYNYSNFNYKTNPYYGLDGTSFNLTDFLEDFGKGHYVNCLDMAKAVTTFANSVGCNLSLMIFKKLNGMFINCIDPIGTPSPTNNPADYPLIGDDCRTGMFEFHAFSMDTITNNVWDATLRYDIDGNPDNVSHPDSESVFCGTITSGHTWDLPSGELYSIYIKRLVDTLVTFEREWYHRDCYDFFSESCSMVYPIEFSIINDLSFHIKTFSLVEKYDFENWPEKNSVSKNSININDNLVSNYKMKLTKGHNDSSLTYKIPLNENDSSKRGRLYVKIFSSPSEAQLALTEYLDCIVTPKLFPRMTSENFKHGDVAFGSEHNGIMQIAFTKNNVLVILHAPAEKAFLLSGELDLIIQNAPELRSNMHPSLLFTR